MKSDLKVGCIPSDGVVCCMRDTGFVISVGLFVNPLKPCPTADGGAGGKNPCVGFNGVMCGLSLGGKGWWAAFDWFVESAETEVGRVKLADGVVILLE